MIFKTETINLTTAEPLELIDITGRIRELVLHGRVTSGILVVSSQHTTASVCINEKCEAIESDFKQFVTTLLPPQASYQHNQIAVDGRPNAHSHLLSFLLPTSQTLVVTQGELQLGTWQHVFFIELDGPRESRQVTLTLLGE